MTTRPGRKRVAVLGAGVAGLTTAFAVRQLGFSVEVIDAAGGPGQGTSARNGGQLSYSYVTPFASPAALAGLPAMLRAKGTIRLHLGASPAQWLWLLRFAACCRAGQVHDTVGALLTLAEESRAAMDRFLSRNPLPFEHRRTGKLVLYRTQAGFDAARRDAELKQALGSRPEVLDWPGCVAAEPALAATRIAYAGGVFTATDETGDCAAFCHGLAALLESDGVRFRWNTEMQGLAVRRNGVALRLRDGISEYDGAVLCLGVDAAAAMGLAARIQPIGGCSLTVPVADAARAPGVSVTDAAAKVVVAPLGRTLRVAGGAVVGGAVPPGFEGEMVAQLEAMYPGAGRLEAATSWTGLRPCTPDGRPIVERGKLAGLFLNCGHGGLGWTLAWGTAHRVAALVGQDLR